MNAAHVAGKPLTQKQKDLLELWMRGQSDKMCADTLRVSYGAIRKRAAGLFRKLHARNKAEAVAHFLQSAGGSETGSN